MKGGSEGRSGEIARHIASVLSEIKSGGVRLKKRLSQHVTASPRLVEWVIQSTDPSLPTIEVGSGAGSITQPLCERLRRPLVGVEIDERLAALSLKFVSCANAVVVNADALLLPWDFPQVVACSPFHISSKLVVKLARSNEVVRAVLVLQKEFADRLGASPGEDSYGSITVLTRLLFEVVPGPVFPPSDFFPRPEVYSRGVVLKRKRAHDEEIAATEALAKKLFSQRRRKVEKALKGVLGSSGPANRCGIEASKRVYELSESEVLCLAKQARELGLL